MTRSDRETYEIDRPFLSVAESMTACAAILELIRPHLGEVYVDAYTDYPDEDITAEGTSARDELLDRGRQRRRGDPGSGIRLDPRDEVDWALLVAWSPYSINVDLLDTEGEQFACLHDSGLSQTVDLVGDEAERLARQLGDGLPLVRLEIILEREQAEKAAAKALSRAQRFGRIKRLSGRTSQVPPGS